MKVLTMNTWKKIAAMFAIMMVAVAPASAARVETATTVSDLHLVAEVKDGMLSGTLSFSLENLTVGNPVPVLGSNVAIISDALPDGMKLLPPDDGGLYRIVARKSFWGGARRGRAEVKFTTAKVESVDLVLPIAPIRTFEISANPEEYEVTVMQAGNVVTAQADGPPPVRVMKGNLPMGELATIQWKHAATRFQQTDPVLSCKADTSSFVAPGVIRHTSQFSFRITQGTVRSYSFRVPRDVNIVSTDTDFGLLKQTVEDSGDPAYSTLTLTSQVESSGAVIKLVYEDALPAFPCKAVIEPISPVGVLRTEGLLLVAPMGSIRILPGAIKNLLQTDGAVVPFAGENKAKSAVLPPPPNSACYRYTTTPCSIEVGLEDIVTAIHAENTVVVKIEDALASIEASLQLDLRDAPADKVVVTIGKAAGWTITSVTGKDVSDGDIEQREKEKGVLEVTVPFDKQTTGMMKIALKMERKIDTTTPGKVVVPEIAVKDAVVQNGYIVASASQGIQLASDTPVNLSEIHAASTPVSVAGAQLAFRFRGAEWAASIGYTRAKTSIHSELFHLVSPGDGIMYASAAATFHISGAPADTFKFRVPAYLKQVEVTCADVDNWSREGDVLTAKLTRRIMGDWTMLISYEQLLDYHGGELTIGEIETIGTESEMGFIVLAGPASLKAEEAEALPQTMIRIGKDEIPEGYSASLLSPVTAAWKYMRTPHTAKIRLTPLASESIIGQVVDFLSIESNITRDGASVTKARYSVKNARGQYLTLKLPEGAKLWAVNKLGEDGSKIAEIPSQFDGGLLLVPVERPRDPNSATTVEIQYATDNSASPKHQTLLAPVVTDSPITFAEWNLTAGDNLALLRTSGNMSADPCGNGLRFTRTSIMPGDKPLELSFSVYPSWLARINVIPAVACAIALILFTVVFVYNRRRIWLAVAVVAAVVLVMQINVMRDEELAFQCFMAGGALILYGMSRRIVRRMACCSAKNRYSDMQPPPLPLVENRSGKGDKEGSMRIGVMLAMCVLGGAALALPLKMDYHGALHGSNVGVRVWSDKIDITVVPPAKDSKERVTMLVTHEIDCTLDKAGAYSYPRFAGNEQEKFVMLDAKLPGGMSYSYGGVVQTEGAAPYVLTALEYVADGELFFIASRPGDYKLRFTLNSKSTADNLKTKPFGAVKSAITVTMPPGELQASPVRLYGEATTVKEDGATVLNGYIAGGDDAVEIKITPKQRDQEKESVVMSADVSTYAAIRSGVVDVTTSIRYRVLQGVVRKVQIRIPDTLHVVDLSGDAAEWSFDNATRLLSVAVKTAMPEGFSLAIRCNAVAKNFPYDCKLSVPDVLGVTRQNGKIGIAAGDSVLLTLADSTGCNVMRNEDFGGTQIPWQGAVDVKLEKVRRAFRYDEAAKVSITVSADTVKPELRSNLNITMSVGDERYTVSSQLELSVAKAGVFSVSLDVPKGYVIETITGDKVLSWDDRRKTDGGVDVMFGNSFEGVCPIYVVLSKQQQGVEAMIAVPRISVKGAAKQTGHIAITAERGVKLTLDAHDGVVNSKNDETSVATKNAVALDILRTDWSASLKTQVLDPVVKPDVLHCVSIAEGMLQHRVYLRCKIENAGVKQFRVVVPAKGASLTVSGRYIARVVPEGEAAADGSQTWLIELQGKVDNEYSATCFYQEQYDSAAAVAVKPLRVVASQRQTGWMVVSGDVRIKVDAEFSATGMRAEDARTIPDTFGAGDLSGALKCWKVLDANTSVALKVTRHSAAEVLPAFVDSMNQTTVLSIGGRTLTQTDIRFSVGRLRFLRIVLPDASADLWTAQVNGASVTVSKEEAGGALCIPLDSVPEGETAEVSFVWAAQPAEKFGGTMSLEAPRFPDLPLRNIGWSVFAPEEYAYSLENEDFDEVDGSMEAVSYRGFRFDNDMYQTRNKARSKGVLEQAKVSFGQVGQMLDSGSRVKAQRALKQAIDLSQADVSLNEDARVQFENVAVQNANIGFINRRDALRTSNNIFTEQGGQQAVADFNGGNFSREFAQKVEGQLSARDRTALQMVSAKIVGQQAAVEETPTAISITMPEHGQSFQFSRALQTQLGGGMKLELSVSRKVTERLGARNLDMWIACLCAIPALWLVLLFAFGSRKRG